MLKLADKNLSAYIGNYRPVEGIKNAEKLFGYKTEGLTNGEGAFNGTYNAPLTVYGKCGYMKSINLCPAPTPQKGSGWVNEDICEWEIVTKQNGYFDFCGSGAMGVEISKAYLKPGTYTFSGCDKVWLLCEGTTDFLIPPATFTIEKQTEVSLYLWYTETENITLENQYIQIEEGSVATDYIPYIGNSDFPPSLYNNCKIFSSSGVVRCEGANVLPSNFTDASAWEMDFQNPSSDRKAFYLDLSPGEYVFEFNYQPLTTYIFLYIQKSNDGGNTYTSIAHPIMNYAVENRVTFTAEKGCLYRFWSWRLEKNFSLFSNWSLKRAEAKERFYKYVEPIEVSVPILKGVEVDETAMYNYKEIENGKEKYYISDILKGDTITHYIGEIVLNGDMIIENVEISSDKYNCYSIDLSEYLNSLRDFDYAMCNCFEGLTSTAEERMGMIFGMMDKKLYLFVPKALYYTVEDFVEFIKSSAEIGNPVIICYILDKPIIEQNVLPKVLKSFPMFTKIITYTDDNAMPLGMNSCIKVQ